MYESVLGLLLASAIDAVAVNFTPPLVTRKTDDIAAAIVAAVDQAAALAEERGAGEEPSAAPRRALKPVVTSLLGADASGQAVLQTAHFPCRATSIPRRR